eukprot:59276-Rhodomonas_salina.1
MQARQDRVCSNAVETKDEPCVAHTTATPQRTPPCARDSGLKDGIKAASRYKLGYSRLIVDGKGLDCARDLLAHLLRAALRGGILFELLSQRLDPLVRPELPQVPLQPEPLAP